MKQVTLHLPDEVYEYYKGIQEKEGFDNISELLKYNLGVDAFNMADDVRMRLSVKDGSIVLYLYLITAFLYIYQTELDRMISIRGLKKEKKDFYRLISSMIGSTELRFATVLDRMQEKIRINFGNEVMFNTNFTTSVTADMIDTIATRPVLAKKMQEHLNNLKKEYNIPERKK